MEISTTKDFAENFQKVFFRDVRPKLALYELHRRNIIERNKKHRKNMFVWCAGIIIATPLITIWMFSHHYNLEILYFWAVAAISLFFTIMSCISTIDSAVKDFEDNAKTEFMPVLMKAFGDFAWHGTYDSRCTSADFSKSSIYQVSNLCTDDNFTGNYNGVGIGIHELNFFYKNIVNKSNKEQSERFSGVAVVLDMNKNFSGQTIVTFRENGVNIIYPVHFQKIELEKSKFSDYFNVYSEDQIESRYLLTLSFMERFVRLGNVFKSNKIEASFSEKKLYIFISKSKDMFKLFDINKPVDDIEQYKTMFNEIIAILEIVDVLKLNEKIGL